MHAPQPERVEGSLSEMPVSEFYGANCAACHGARRQGGIGPPLVPSRLIESDEFYFEVIANGRPGTAMPAWSQLGLSSADTTALIAFLRTEP
jgi:mono/diheme cytochrome c family protein